MSYVEAFDLVEDAVSACRDGFVAEDSSGEDGAYGWTLAFHDAYLNTAGVSAKEYVGVGVDKECVLHVARWVFGREVERSKDMPIVFDFGTFGDGEAESGEDVDYLIFDDGDGVS